MNKKVFYKILIHGFLIAMAVITLTPFIWLLLSSFKSNIEILAPNQTLFPKEFMISNYDKVNTQFNFMQYFTSPEYMLWAQLLMEARRVVSMPSISSRLTAALPETSPAFVTRMPANILRLKSLFTASRNSFSCASR